MTYFRLLFKRLNQFFELEWDFFMAFLNDKLETYSDRLRYYRFWQWWTLFVWTVVFSFNYGLVRLAIYAVSLAFRLLFLPLRLAVELYVPFPFLRKIFFFFFSFFETVGGILWIRERYLEFAEGLRYRLEQKWEAKKKALFQSWEERNPIVRAFETLVRIDERFNRFERRVRGWLFYRLFRYWICRRIPGAYRAFRRWFFLRYRYLRFRSRRFRKWRLRKEYALYVWNGFLTKILETRLVTWLTITVAYVHWGWRLCQLAGRFVWNLLRMKGPPLGRRHRFPSSETSKRYNLSRPYLTTKTPTTRPISRSAFNADHQPQNEYPYRPKGEAPNQAKDQDPDQTKDQDPDQTKDQDPDQTKDQAKDQTKDQAN